MKIVGIAKVWSLSLALACVSVYGQQSAQSPFQAPRAVPVEDKPAAEQPSPLDSFEFNGIMTMNGKTRVSVYDTQTKENHWLSEGEQAESGLKLQRYDKENETIVLARGGTMKKLSLKQVQIEPLRIADQPAPASPQSPAVGVTAPPPGSVAESDEEVRERMQRVAEEIRRRRAERRQRLEERRQGQN